jgi:hypothetical protein
MSGNPPVAQNLSLSGPGSPDPRRAGAIVAGIASPARWQVFADNVLNKHPNLSNEHTNPGDPRFQAVTFRPRAAGLTMTFRF